MSEQQRIEEGRRERGFSAPFSEGERTERRDQPATVRRRESNGRPPGLY